MLEGSGTKAESVELNNFLRRVLKRLFAALHGRSAKNAESESGPAARFEVLARFVFSSKYFAVSRLKPSAFLPTSNLKTSAFGIDELQENEIWQIGDYVAGAGRKLTALARGDFKSSDVAEVGLGIVPDPAPHPRHVDICGWPDVKDERKEIALELCARAHLHRRTKEQR